MIRGKIAATITLLILGLALMVSCAGPAPHDDFVAKLENENIDPSHYVVNVGLRTQCEAHSETGFMEKYYAEREFIRASNNKTVPLYSMYNDEESKILTATILAMESTIDGGTKTRVFCQSLGFN